MAYICNLFNTYNGSSSVSITTSVGTVNTSQYSDHCANDEGSKKHCNGYRIVESSAEPTYCKCLEYYGYKYDSVEIGDEAPVLNTLPYWYNTSQSKYINTATRATVGRCNEFTSSYTHGDTVEKWTLVQNKCHLYSMPRIPTPLITIGEDVIDTLDLHNVYESIKTELNKRQLNTTTTNTQIENFESDVITPNVLNQLILDLQKTCETTTNPGSINTKTDFKTLHNSVSKDHVIRTATILDILNYNYSLAVSDCICYADCNSYSVCWCYGNCNYY